jgi:DNA-binding MarR family transcriptional regulator
MVEPMSSSERMARYIPRVREFAARVVLFHDAVAQLAGLNLTDAKLLRLLGDAAATPGQLARQSGLTGAAITAAIDRLVAAGFVARSGDPTDRRRVKVRAVPAKVRQFDRLYAHYGAAIAGQLEKYDAKEFRAIEQFLAETTQLLTDETQRLRSRARPALPQRTRPAHSPRVT